MLGILVRYCALTHVPTHTDTPACHYLFLKIRVGPAFYLFPRSTRALTFFQKHLLPFHPMGNSETDKRHVLELSDPAQFLDGDTCRHFVGKHGRQRSPLGGGVWNATLPFRSNIKYVPSHNLLQADYGGGTRSRQRKHKALSSDSGPFPGGRPRSGRPPKMAAAAAPRLGRLPRAWPGRRASQRGRAGSTPAPRRCAPLL